MDTTGTKHLERLCSDLNTIQGYPWAKLGTWVERAHPIITAYFPEHAEQFRSVVRQPAPTAMPVVLVGDKTKDDAAIKRAGQIEEATDRENYTGTRDKIAAFVSGLLSVARDAAAKEEQAARDAKEEAKKAKDASERVRQSDVMSKPSIAMPVTCPHFLYQGL